MRAVFGVLSTDCEVNGAGISGAKSAGDPPHEENVSVELIEILEAGLGRYKTAF